jgi:hypothetical protein
MYKLSTLICTLIAGTILFTSCKDDEPAPVIKENSFTFEGETYDLSRAYGREYDNGPGATIGYSLVLISDEGRESVLLLFNVPDGTLEGTYAPTHPSGEEPNTFSSVGIEIGYDPVTEEPGTIYRTRTTPRGTISVDKSGNVYVIDFDVTMDAGEIAKGHYTGTITQQ